MSELGANAMVKRNDELTLADIAGINPSHIIISPGPKTPDEAGISLEAIHHFGEQIPILGVCLGHQAIGQAYGGKVVRANYPMHGKASFISHSSEDLFHHLENPLKAARYHSLVVANENLPKELIVTARCERGEIMALRHYRHPVFGVQFHPESILTDSGHGLLSNFLRYKLIPV